MTGIFITEVVQAYKNNKEMNKLNLRVFCKWSGTQKCVLCTFLD